jgi:hypothetical protein
LLRIEKVERVGLRVHGDPWWGWQLLAGQ